MTTETDNALADLARLEVGEELLALFLLRLLEPCAAGQHDVVAVLVELDDLGLQRAADIGLEVADAAQLDQRGGKEAAEADVEDEAALDDLDDRALDDAVALLDLLDVAPCPLVLRPLLGEDETTFLVFLLEDQRLDLVAQADDLVRIDVVADGQLAGGDHTLGLEADVEKDFVLVDLDDRAVDDVAVVELDDGAGDGVLEGHAAEIVDRDLAGGVLTALVECAHLGLGFGGGSLVRHREVVARFPDEGPPAVGPLLGDVQSYFTATVRYSGSSRYGRCRRGRRHRA